MKEIFKKINLKVLFPILATVCVVSAVTFNALRYNWVFIDIALFSPFTFVLLILMVIGCLLIGVLWALKLYEKDVNKKAYVTLTVISTISTVIFAILSIVYLIVAVVKESYYVTYLYFIKSLPMAAAFVIIPLAILFIPKFSKKVMKSSFCVILAGTLIFGFLQLFPITNYEITSAPMVIDNGEEYSIVFATNKKGTGYVCYTYEGVEYKIYDDEAGRINTDSLVHNIQVPYEHLKNNTYYVGSARVIGDYSYGSRLGGEVVSDEYTFTVNESENQSYLVVSDWHTKLKEAYSAISNLGEYDAILLMGDSSPGLDFEEEFVKFTVEFGGTLSNGEIPIIYCRGNHETRGAYASSVKEALGLNDFNYTVSLGDVEFIVLDSGEDKEDSHAEYGSLNNYEAYRAETIEWLSDVEVESDKVITLVHSWSISDVEEELKAEGWNLIDSLGTRLTISGHTHECRLIGTENEEEIEFLSNHSSITAYMDGGYRDSKYTASKLVISNDTFELIAYNSEGENVFNETFEW